jgi:hypothetical protein
VAAERVHQREVPVAAVAWPEDVFDKRLQTLIAQSRIDILDELFLLAWPDIEKIGSCLRLLKREGGIFRRLPAWNRRKQSSEESDHFSRNALHIHV